MSSDGYLQVCPAGRFGVCCHCGWQGPDRSGETAAQHDLDDHLRLHQTLLAVKAAAMLRAAHDEAVDAYLRGDHWTPPNSSPLR